MRLALAVITLLVTGGLGVAAAIPDGLAIRSAYLSKIPLTQMTRGLVTVYNGSTKRLRSFSLDCSALRDDGQLQEVTMLAFLNVEIGETVYGETTFLDEIESGSHLSCRITDVSP